jgi:hypothetical protein
MAASVKNLNLWCEERKQSANITVECEPSCLFAVLPTSSELHSEFPATARPFLERKLRLLIYLHGDCAHILFSLEITTSIT